MSGCVPTFAGMMIFRNPVAEGLDSTGIPSFIGMDNFLFRGPDMVISMTLKVFDDEYDDKKERSNKKTHYIGGFIRLEV